MTMTVDRIEGDFAVCECENKEMLQIPLKELPDNIHEGAVILETENGYFLDTEEEEIRKKEIEERFKKLFKK